MSHEGKAGSKAVGVRAPEPSHHAWQNPTSTAGQSPAPKGRLPGTRSAGQARRQHAREGAGSALVAPAATHPDSDPSTTSTQKAAPSRWSTRDSTGSAGCPGRCSRCCSRCSGRSSSRTGPARARQPLGEAAGAAAARGRGGPCGRGDSCEEGVRCGGDLGRLERVVGREVDVQEEDASLVRRVFLRVRARDV